MLTFDKQWLESLEETFKPHKLNRVPVFHLLDELSQFGWSSRMELCPYVCMSVLPSAGTQSLLQQQQSSSQLFSSKSIFVWRTLTCDINITCSLMKSGAALSLNIQRLKTIQRFKMYFIYFTAIMTWSSDLKRQVSSIWILHFPWCNLTLQ